jgi:hypothetical protein
MYPGDFGTINVAIFLRDLWKGILDSKGQSQQYPNSGSDKYRCGGIDSRVDEEACHNVALTTARKQTFSDSETREDEDEATSQSRFHFRIDKDSTTLSNSRSRSFPNSKICMFRFFRTILKI